LRNIELSRLQGVDNPVHDPVDGAPPLTDDPIAVWLGITHPDDASPRARAKAEEYARRYGAPDRIGDD
jgi:hypothetical protein